MRSPGVHWFYQSVFLLLSVISTVSCGGGADNTPPPQPTPQNAAPVPGSNTFQLNEDSSLQGQLSASDADNDQLSYQLSSQSQAQGAVSLQSDGRFTYQPTADFAGEASFAFTVSDGKNPPVAGNAKLTVQNINDLPQAAPQQFAGIEDTAATFLLKATDADQDPLTFTLQSVNPANAGVVVSAAGSISLKPLANLNGKIALQLQVTDGKSAAVTFGAEISLAAVNDAPTLTVTALPALLDAGQSYALSFKAEDVDGDMVTVSNAQTELFRLDRSQTNTSLQVLARTDAVETELLLQAADPQGATAQYKQKVLLAIPNGNAMGRTLVGSVQSNRLNLVIVGDGFTAAEQQKLRDAAVKFSQVFFNSKEIGTHRDGWSLHVLDAVSAQSGADDPSTNTLVDTLFDGNFGCAGVDRLYCVNSSKVFSYVFQHYPQFDFVLVAGNSTKYGGAGGSISTFTLHQSATDVAIHELGHSFARLADEYVDEASAPMYLPYYCETCYANITQLTDLTQVKWRHWFSDPAKVPTQPGQAGVGLFEGGYYLSKGFYRPKDNSFMLELGQPIGEINGEAWVNQLYQNIGMYHSPQPAQPQVVQQRGQSQLYSLALSVGPAQQKVQWLLNGQVMSEFDNKTSISCCQDQQQNYQLKAVITDISGLIKAPALVSQEVQWNVQIQ
jgi:VCBS repeat-containing protein